LGYQRIGQFRYIKIQSKIIDPSTRLWRIITEFVGFFSQQPCSSVYCIRLNFNILKSVYYNGNNNNCGIYIALYPNKGSKSFTKLCRGLCQSAYLNFRKIKVALSPMCRLFLKLCQKLHLILLIKV